MCFDIILWPFCGWSATVASLAKPIISWNCSKNQKWSFSLSKISCNWMRCHCLLSPSPSMRKREAIKRGSSRGLAVLLVLSLQQRQRRRNESDTSLLAYQLWTDTAAQKENMYGFHRSLSLTDGCTLSVICFLGKIPFSCCVPHRQTGGGGGGRVAHPKHKSFRESQGVVWARVTLRIRFVWINDIL